MIHLITGSLAMAHNIHNIQLNGGNQCIFNVYFAYEMAHFFFVVVVRSYACLWIYLHFGFVSFEFRSIIIWISTRNFHYYFNISINAHLCSLWVHFCNYSNIHTFQWVWIEHFSNSLCATTALSCVSGHDSIQLYLTFPHLSSCLRLSANACVCVCASCHFWWENGSTPIKCWRAITT